MSSTWLARLGRKSDTHAPVSPYCFQVRLVASRLPTPPSVAVFRPLAKESGSGLPASLISSGL